MELSSGTRVGGYEILGPLGAGGMGVVYRARDLRLNREVAIKALPSDVAADPERLARFEREAQVLASLVDPHIATIHGVVESNGASFIVLELVEGQSLAERLGRGPLPVHEALAIARQVADGLQTAHRRGIVHRDLKPANVMISPDGRVKVLDFGLATIESRSERDGQTKTHLIANSPTITSPAMTQPGLILGTAPYMSPEQAKGGATDRRTDIWSMGCVLYEMLTGRRPFDGSDVTEVIAAVVGAEPDWTRLPAELPPVASVYLRRCLQKNPNERVQDIGDLKLALDGAFDVPASDARLSVTPKSVALALAALLVVAVLAATAAWRLKPDAPDAGRPQQRFTVTSTAASLAVANTNTDVAISPDGSRLAFMAGDGSSRAIYVRRFDSLDAIQLRPVLRAFEPFFSPDGQWLAYNDESDYTLRRISVDGGPPLVIARIRQEIFGATWGDDGSIVYANTLGLWLIPPGAAEPQLLAKPDTSKGELGYGWPHFLPGATALVFNVRYGAQPEEMGVAALDLSTRAVKGLLRGGMSPRYAPSGHLVFGVEGTLRAVRFDAKRLQVSGDPVLVVEGVITKSSGSVDFGIARNGTLVYVSGLGDVTPKRLAWVGRDGSRRPLNAPARAYATARVSPDGSQIALEARDQESDIWIWDIAGERLRRLTSGAAFEGLPAWTPDGRHLLFASMKNGILQVFRQPADGSGEAELLHDSRVPTTPISALPAGDAALVRTEGSGAGEDIGLLPLKPGATVTTVLATPFAETNAEVSPDGRWLLYQSNESGGIEVFVRPYPNVQDGRWPVTSGGGLHATWTSRGSEVLYIAGDGQLMRVPVSTRTGFQVGPATVAVRPPFYASNIPRTYDATKDGRQILIIEDVSGAPSSSTGVTVVLNWTTELTQRLGR